LRKNTHKSRKGRPVREGSEDLLPAITEIARHIQVLNQQAVREYSPIVEAILLNRSCDPRHIERTLDGLLDFCGYEPVVQLYRRLCRHYYAIDQAATVHYVNAYRELWDAEESTVSSAQKANHVANLRARNANRPRSS
jgi:transposase